MEKLYLIFFSVLFSAIIGLVAYFLKTMHAEVKQLIKELTDYTNKLKQVIVGIQMQIDKSIETDIKEIKEDIKTLYQRTNKNNN